MNGRLTVVEREDHRVILNEIWWNSKRRSTVVREPAAIPRRVDRDRLAVRRHLRYPAQRLRTRAVVPVRRSRLGGRLTDVQGESLAVHLRRLAAVRQVLIDRLRPMSVKDFHTTRERYDVPPAWVVHHLLQHESEHRAEIGWCPRSLRAVPLTRRRFRRLLDQVLASIAPYELGAVVC
jgi:hypothetical protein